MRWKSLFFVAALIPALACTGWLLRARVSRRGFAPGGRNGLERRSRDRTSISIAVSTRNSRALRSSCKPIREVIEPLETIPVLGAA